MKSSDTENTVHAENELIMSTLDQTSSYRSIFKATSLFGGVQVYQILIGVVKSKLIAILLESTGMGIVGLYQSTVDLVKSISSFGLEQSAVRDIAEAKEGNDTQRVGRIVSTVRRLVWFTGIFGFCLTLFLSPLLSKLTFGNSYYICGFAILSVSLLFDQLCAGQKVLIQGMHRLKDLAKASAIGSLVGLVISIPLYHWFGVAGIVPTMLLTSFSGMLVSCYYARKITVETVKVKFLDALINGRSMIRMGISLSVSGFLVSVCACILRWFMRGYGGVELVGLFTAGYVIMNVYVGMVFKAMATDYYSRLSAVNNDNIRCKEIINQQGEVAILILAPLVISCMIFLPFIIRIIYSTAFLPVTDFVLWAILGMMFKAASWSISYSFIAKAEARLFIVNETISNMILLVLQISGFFLYGLKGLGLALTLCNLIYLIQVYSIARARYGFAFTGSFRSVFSVQFIAVLVSFIVIISWHSRYVYIPVSVVLIASGFYSLKELNRRIKVFSLLRNKIYGKR